MKAYNSEKSQTKKDNYTVESIPIGTKTVKELLKEFIDYKSNLNVERNIYEDNIN